MPKKDTCVHPYHGKPSQILDRSALGKFGTPGGPGHEVKGD